MEKITLGGGCFWCMDAVFRELKGVADVVSGYSGGTIPNPTYEQVSTGRTGHAEVIEITFDPTEISLHDLLTVFFTLHDPTTLDEQGSDVGTQYRSVIFYRNDEQLETAEQVMEEIMDQGIWEDALVTELTPFKDFYPAEEEHQDFFAENQRHPYCQLVIQPKVAKFRKEFRDKLQAV